MDAKSDYEKLVQRTKDIVILGSVEGVINWDMETMMPPKAIMQRSDQLALISRIRHKMSTSPEIGRLIAAATRKSNYEKLSYIEKRNVDLLKKSFDEQTKLPSKLVEQISKQQAISVNTWKMAKSKQDYSMFKPELEKLVELNKKAADILMKVRGVSSPYDALIDGFEPKMTTREITKTFNELQKQIQSLMIKCERGGNQPDTGILNTNVSVEDQKKISKILAEFAGYDITSTNAGGRIDESEHPFTTGYFDDVRITTHYHEDKFASSIFSVLHEMGHALYEQGINQMWKYQPVGSPCSFGIHESQSRFLENMIGRSKEFWSFFLPKLRQVINLDTNIDDIVFAVNNVMPSKIRIEADEITYNLHIIIRFQMERDLFAGKIDVGELPEIWNDKYHDLLGLRIKNDSEGVMQDTHWASGLFGYFPSYALGNIYGGQMLEKMNKDIPNWRTSLARGDLKEERTWLAKNVYENCNIYDPAILIKKITGSSLTVRPYIAYLREKFGKFYGFK